jgi:pectate lyase
VAKLHPRLLATGVSLIDIQSKSGLTIFSTNGATLRHACLNVKNTANIIIRNLKFAEMWEWDELSKGNYDKNDWDSIDLGNGGTVTNIWIDHCTFTKTYDGQVDIKQGSGGITFSWCKYIGDDGATNTNSWVRQQISSLESNKTSYAMYNFLRSNGFSTEDIIVICQGHDKTHLIGANSLKAENAGHTITFHHDWFVNPWDRLPRLRAGNVHNFNIYVDDTAGLVAKRLRDARAAAMSSANQSTLNNTYNFNP